MSHSQTARHIPPLGQDFQHMTSSMSCHWPVQEKYLFSGSLVSSFTYCCKGTVSAPPDIVFLFAGMLSLQYITLLHMLRKAVIQPISEN